MEKNIDVCLEIPKNWDFKALQLTKEFEDFILNISSNYNYDPKVLCNTMLPCVGHSSDIYITKQ